LFIPSFPKSHNRAEILVFLKRSFIEIPGKENLQAPFELDSYLPVIEIEESCVLGISLEYDN